MRFRVLDIETVPDHTVWTPGEDQYRLVPGHPLAGTEGRVHEACAIKSEPFPPPHACRVVAISTVDIVMDFRASPRYRFEGAASHCSWAVHPSSDRFMEMVLIENFSDSMAGGEITLVTWNGRCFDLPVLSMRALKLGVPFGWYYKDRGMRYRYGEDGHLDLMDFLGDYGAARNAKLGDVARLIGLPGKIGEVSGAGVHDIYRSTLDKADEGVVRAKQASVAQYCMQDTIQTALIFLRSRFHLGKIDRAEYNLCLDTFIQSPVINEAIDIEWGNLKL
jgi:Predicted 3'-5' exonuclease related to the exonuclease domain of PolB